LEDTYVLSPQKTVSHILRVSKDGNGTLFAEYGSKREREGTDVALLERMDISPFKYGYSNFNGTVVFVTRMPLRNDWRQGNRINQLQIQTLTGRNVRGEYDISMWDLKDTVENKFYKYSTCLDMMEDGYGARAINRDFAVNRDFQLFYRNINVGNINLDNGEVDLLPKFFWLQESINEMDNFKEIK